MKFYPSSFYWDTSVFATLSGQTSRHSHKLLTEGQKNIVAACEILNAMTPEQQAAVELYGRSQYLEGENSVEI